MARHRQTRENSRTFDAVKSALRTAAGQERQLGAERMKREATEKHGRRRRQVAGRQSCRTRLYHSVQRGALAGSSTAWSSLQRPRGLEPDAGRHDRIPPGILASAGSATPGQWSRWISFVQQNPAGLRDHSETGRRCRVGCSLSALPSSNPTPRSRISCARSSATRCLPRESRSCLGHASIVGFEATPEELTAEQWTSSRARRGANFPTVLTQRCGPLRNDNAGSRPRQTCRTVTHFEYGRLREIEMPSPGAGHWSSRGSGRSLSGGLLGGADHWPD